MPVFKIQHITRYQYDRPVFESVNEIRIFPYMDNQQEVLQHNLHITDHPELYSYSDYWGNRASIFSLIHSHQELVIDSRLTVRTTASPELLVNMEGRFDQLKREMDMNLQLLELTRPDTISGQAAIDDICRQLLEPGLPVARVVERASEYIFNHFAYTKGITNIETTVDEILEHRGGVCQDFAHVLLQILRNLSIPCRYVSGYICPNKDGMRGEGATHAWIEAWIPDYGWAGIDPTNNVWITNNHVKLAVGRHFSDCSPVKGTFKGPARQDLFVLVSVGYEDGHHIEATNQVKLEKQPAPDPEPLVNESFGAQQQ